MSEEHLRKVIDIESACAAKWRNRAEKAEMWWMAAAPLLAEIGRMYELDTSHMVKVRALMEWEPE